MKNHRYVFYKDRPEWADVIPVPQYEGEIKVLKIAYTPEFVDAHDYMRAVLMKDERSERALEITTTVLQLNPANYTVWEYRRRIMTTLGSDLVEELNFVGKLIDESSKNYQLWHHRQWIVTRLAEKAQQADPSGEELANLGTGELAFTESVIQDDSKHYHAWQYRRWAVNYFKVPAETELAFTEALIEEDMYNNSAWNHRFVTVTKDEGLTPAVLERELEFTQQQIRAAPCNDSSWNYLYGLLVPPPCVLASGAGRRRDTSSQVTDETKQSETPSESRLVIYPPSGTNLGLMRRFAEDLAESDAPGAANSVALFSFLVEVYSDLIQSKVQAEHAGDHVSGDQTTGTDAPADQSESVADLLERAQAICERLALELDRIRMTYWRYRSRQLKVMATVPNL